MKPVKFPAPLSARFSWQWVGGAVILAGVVGSGYLWYQRDIAAIHTAAPRRVQTRPLLSKEHTRHRATKSTQTRSSSAPHSTTTTAQKHSVPPSAPATTQAAPSLWATMAMIDTHYLTQLVALQHQALPWLTTSVANDATVGANNFNNPMVLQHDHVPPLPVSLAAAGVSTAKLPAPNAIMGITPTHIAQWQEEAAHGPISDHLSSAQLTQAVTVATQYLLDVDGNGFSGAYLANPFSAPVSGSRTYELSSSAVSVSALTGSQGLFAQRQYVYQEWANVGQVTIGFSTLDSEPPGHIVTTLLVNHIQVTLVMGGIDHGDEIIGSYPTPPTNVAVDLIHDRGQTRWYVSWASSGNTNNPSQVLWVGPTAS